MVVEFDEPSGMLIEGRVEKSAKSGTRITVTSTPVTWKIFPLFPVIAKLYVPSTTPLGIVMLRLAMVEAPDDRMVLFGLTSTTALCKTEAVAVKFTSPANPFRLVTVILEETLPKSMTFKTLGLAARRKSGAGTVAWTWTELNAEPFVALTRIL